MTIRLLEACADSAASAIEAAKGGAERVELCANLIIGGTSPSEFLFRQVQENTTLKIRPLIRPRFGDFCYDDWEFEAIREEVRLFKRLGADGVVVGILRPDGNLDMDRMKLLMEDAEGMGVSLHRAFDVSIEPFKTLEECISLGIDTILTSGQAATAWQGRKLLKELNEKAAGRLRILAGSGINVATIEKMIEETGIYSYHMSAKTVLDSRMIYRKEGVPMGIGEISEFEIWRTSAEEIAKATKLIYG